VKGSSSFSAFGVGRTNVSFTVFPVAFPEQWQDPSAHPCPFPLSRVVDVSVPKLHISGTYNLKKTLTQLGIGKIFEENGDLTRISPHRSLRVGEVSLSTPSQPGPLSQQLNQQGLYLPGGSGWGPALLLASHVILGKP
jgi:hypothetical protein